MNEIKYLVFLGLLVSTQVAAEHDPYGLLFTSPDQRARLDNRFGMSGGDTSGQTGPGNSESVAAVVQPLRLNGTLISSVGKRQVWINGRGQMAVRSNQSAQVRLLNSHKVEVRPAASGATHTLKPGQILDPSTGQVSEAYEQVSRP